MATTLRAGVQGERTSRRSLTYLSLRRKWRAATAIPDLALFRGPRPSTNTAHFAIECASQLPVCSAQDQSAALVAQDMQQWRPLVPRECAGCGAELKCAAQCASAAESEGTVVLLTGIAARCAQVCTCIARTCGNCGATFVAGGRADAFVVAPPHTGFHCQTLLLRRITGCCCWAR